MNNPLNDAKVGAWYAPVQWKIALGWMHDANKAASGSHGLLTPAATRKITEYHLDRYFEMVEAQLTQAAG